MRSTIYDLRLPISSIRRSEIVLTDTLKAQGCSSVNKSVRVYDLNAFIGGPILQDKLWFTSSHRRVGQQHRVANLYRNANLEARVFGAPVAVWRFAPDLTKPVEPTEDDPAHNLRLTWQATPKDKLTVSYDWQWNKSQDNNGAFNAGTGAADADPPGAHVQTRLPDGFLIGNDDGPS